MKIGLVIYSGEAETVWSAFRYANHALSQGDKVSAFLIGQGVTIESVGTDIFQVGEQAQAYLRAGGKLMACKTCLELHHIKPSELYRVSVLKDLHEMVQESDKVLTF